jgi:hypothetical protein
MIHCNLSVEDSEKLIGKRQALLIAGAIAHGQEMHCKVEPKRGMVGSGTAHFLFGFTITVAAPDILFDGCSPESIITYEMNCGKRLVSYIKGAIDILCIKEIDIRCLKGD